MANTNFSSPSDSALRRRLSALTSGPQSAALRQGLRGIEKESLRVTRDGTLATTPHPRTFGSALTHPLITTDYSEALIELITPAEHDVARTLEQLDDLHRFAYAHLGSELLWNDGCSSKVTPPKLSTMAPAKPQEKLPRPCHQLMPNSMAASQIDDM